MENRRLCLGDRTRSIVAGRDVAGSDPKNQRAAQMRSSGLFVAVCVGGLTHSPHGSKCVFVRLGPRSRIGTRTVPAAPSASASNALRLLIAPLLLKVLKLAAVRITRQLAQ